MACILLIDDDSEWLDLIRRALPEYQVDQAQSYDEALAQLSGDTVYDVAIVDLNLLETGRDRLGGKLLEIMRDEYPSTRRIALTGLPPTAVKDVFDRYDVEDLLLKGPLVDLAAVRDVVEAALRGSSDIAADIPADLKAEKSRLSSSLRSWKAGALAQFNRRARTLENDINDAGRVGKVAETSAVELRELQTRRECFETDCAALATCVANICTRQEAVQASRQLEKFRSTYEV